MAEVVIIGGGAAGMAASIAAASCGDHVTILERMDRVGKKLLATGNGRCNLMNVLEPRYPGGGAFAQEVLRYCGVEEQTAFWQSLGLRMRVEEGGRVYPVSGQASSVLDALRMAMASLKIDVATGFHVDELKNSSSGFKIYGQGQKLYADSVIVAGGGCAQPKLGSNGSTWRLLEAFGHRLVTPRPCLTQIVTDTEPIRGLSGIRARCQIQVKKDSKLLHEESGELLFADYGVSGVCVMQCARYAAPGTTLHVNFAAGMGFEEREQLRLELVRRRKYWADRPLETLLTGLCVPRLSLAIFHAANLSGMVHRMTCTHLTNKYVDALIYAMTDFVLPVRSVKGFETAQVTAGGIDWNDFDPRTISSRLCANLHAAGEVLDVDGDCGGYNLMFAFGSGILAGLDGRKIQWR